MRLEHAVTLINYYTVNSSVCVKFDFFEFVPFKVIQIPQAEKSLLVEFVIQETESY